MSAAVTAALAQLRAAVRTLNAAHGIVGRRNSRARVARAVRALRAAVDSDYPGIVRKPGARRRRRVSEQTTVSQWEAAAFAAVGVKVRRGTNAVFSVPAWAARIGSRDVKRLRLVLKSRTARAAILTELDLARAAQDA